MPLPPPVPGMTDEPQTGLFWQLSLADTGMLQPDPEPDQCGEWFRANSSADGCSKCRYTLELLHSCPRTSHLPSPVFGGKC